MLVRVDLISVNLPLRQVWSFPSCQFVLNSIKKRLKEFFLFIFPNSIPKYFDGGVAFSGELTMLNIFIKIQFIIYN